jgi:hypothetical protein
MFFGSSKPVYTKPAKAYKINAPSGEWQRLNRDDIDAAFWNQKIKSGMAIAVDCSADIRGEHGAITKRLFIGIKNRRITESSEIILNKKKAVTATAKGAVDNKDIMMKVYTVLDDGCVYDLAYWTFNDDLEEGLPDFEAFVKSLRWEGKSEEGEKR